MSRMALDPRAPAGRRLKLFCLPYAGGSAVIYNDWKSELSPEITVVPVEIPGRGKRRRELPLTHIGMIVDTLLNELQAELDAPCAFFGHSMGAVVAYEICRTLAKRGAASPRRLIVAGRRAPHLTPIHPPLHSLPHDELIAELYRLNGTPSEILKDAGVLELVIPILRADCQAAETYSPEIFPLLDCPISTFGGVADRDVTSDALAAWRDLTHGPFKARMFPGDHFFIHSARDWVINAVRLDLLSP